MFYVERERERRGEKGRGIEERPCELCLSSSLSILFFLVFETIRSLFDSVRIVDTRTYERQASADLENVVTDGHRRVSTHTHTHSLTTHTE